MAGLRAAIVGGAIALLINAAPAIASARGHLASGGDLNISLGRIMLALLLCIGIAVIAAIAIKRGGGQFNLARWPRSLGDLASERRMHVIEARRISVHADLCLVRCDAREYLILSSATAQQVLETRIVGDGG